ncbi:MAG: hypothetical protein ACOVK6_08955 [Ramlibacter sp.]|jgi:hypothetical protein
MKYSFFLVWGLALVPGLLQAQPTQASRVYRCGNQYTNTPTEAQAPGCKLLEGASVTVVQGVRPAVAAAPPAGQGTAGVSGPVASLRVDSAEQRARDADARAILEAELRKAQARQGELLREYNNGEPEKLGPETRNYQKYLDRVAHLKASIARNEADIEGLRRELSRLTASK